MCFYFPDMSSAGYTHLANQHLVEATQKAGSIIAEAMRDDVTTCWSYH